MHFKFCLFALKFNLLLFIYFLNIWLNNSILTILYWCWSLYFHRVNIIYYRYLLIITKILFDYIFHCCMLNVQYRIKSFLILIQLHIGKTFVFNSYKLCFFFLFYLKMYQISIENLKNKSRGKPLSWKHNTNT